VVMGWSAVNCGRSGSPGFSASKVEPRGASGVMLMPVGKLSAAEEAVLGCWFLSAARRGSVQTHMAKMRSASRRVVILLESTASASVPGSCLLQALLELVRRDLAQRIVQQRRQSYAGQGQAFVHDADVGVVVGLIDRRCFLVQNFPG